jgi:hypothetical protein
MRNVKGSQWEHNGNFMGMQKELCGNTLGIVGTIPNNKSPKFMGSSFLVWTNLSMVEK